MDIQRIVGKFASFVILFQFCGACIGPINLPSKFKIPARILIIISVGHILFNLSIIAYGYFHPQYIISSVYASMNFNEYIQVFTPILANLVVLSESLYYRHLDTKMWSQIYELETVCIKMRRDNHHDFITTLYRNYLWIFMPLNVITISVELFNVVSISTIFEIWFINYLMRVPSFLLNRINHLYYLLIVIIIERINQFVGNEIEQIDRKLKRSLRRPNDHEISKKLVALKRMYSLLWALNRNLNQRFGWALLTGMLAHFLVIVISGYWYYFRLYFNVMDVFLGKNLTQIFLMYVIFYTR